MADQAASQPAKSVQDYIDETPSWADGTPASAAPLTPMQLRVWMLAAAGKFFEGLVIFTTGVALPLIGQEFQMSPLQHGMVGAASLFGILIGAFALGGLADIFGRKLVFIAEMVIFMIFLALLSVSQGFLWMLICMVGVGLALGCDYPTAHLIISESIPSRARGKLVLGAFGFQAVGALAGTITGYVILHNFPEVTAWRYMFAVALLPAAVVLVGRFFITESAPWLFARGRVDEATRAAMRLLRREPPYPKEITLAPAPRAPADAAPEGFRAVLAPAKRRAAILAGVPWFLQDLGTYGIGLFTPTILATTFGHSVAVHHSLASVIDKDLLAAKGAALVDILLILGIGAATLLADRAGRIPLQILGFIGCAAGLLLSAQALNHAGMTQTVMIYTGFMLFNFMTNLGPNAQTYLIAGEVFPARMRARGAGVAAAFAKIGAVTTAFLFPILLADIGTQNLLYILVVTSLAGAFVTWRYRIETTGLNLDRIGEKPADPA
ncbi:MAG: MFS transporter [Rhizobiales bacterium]|nr:MFS transporter [Hyphomicrobiales bacterium]